MNIDQSFKAKYKIAKLEVHAIKKGQCKWHGIQITHKVESLFTHVHISGEISAN